jgi:hypothetical protein
MWHAITTKMLMKNTICTLIAVAALLNSSAGMDVYIVAGQSNAVGQGSAAQLPPQYASVNGAYIYNQGVGIVPLSVTTCLGQDHGIELSFASRLVALSQQEVCLVKVARNGSSMADPNPVGLFGTWSPFAGDLFDSLVADVQQAVLLLEAAGHDPVIRGMAWWQGESDAHSSGIAHEQYAARLQVFMDALRAELQTPSMGVCIVRCGTNIGSWSAPFPFMSSIRSAQEAVGSLSNSCWVGIDDLYAADIHPPSPALITAGLRAADALYEEVFGDIHTHVQAVGDGGLRPDHYAVYDMSGRVVMRATNSGSTADLIALVTSMVGRPGLYVISSTNGARVIYIGDHVTH